MIAILFVDGLIAFVANEFARYFNLKIPCLFCTRIDHVLVRRDPDFYYNDSICETHRKDVSSLAYCHVHQRLSDIRRMCEGCLLSFATENKSNRETYRSLVGILGADLECSVEDDHKIHLRLPAERKKDQVQLEKSSIHRCSCCGEPLRVKSSFQHAPNGDIVPQAPAPSPRVLAKSKSMETRRVDPLPHIRYTELKFMSDTESEIPEDEESAGKEDSKAATVPLLTESEDHSEEACKTPSYIRASRLLNIALTDSAAVTPRGPERPFRKLFADRTESEHLELNTASESEGDIILSHLKKQVRLDRKSLIALYMELDEERSASAVAANQAMAMITRLQAEKAAMQMEALQYQRMMEEQAEYDQEALQVMKDSLTKREDEIKMLKERLGEEALDIEDCKSRADDDYLKSKYTSNTSISQISECGSPHANFYDEVGNEEDFKVSCTQTGPSQIEEGYELVEEPLLDQESERIYLLERLRVLEKIHLSKSRATSSELLSSDISNSEDEYTGDGCNREISQLSKRMEAIENDREFLKHAFQSLQKGDEGTQLLKEIAQHLRELRQEKTPVECMEETKVVVEIESS
ncbi:Myosin-binding protein [Thalictrum thalictroides]|uniref:Myosin-binding protein n=1 Tax=Thalictrum thalictroides TaxID=46969 RepID=A0A7J6WNG5_THATH|nr:Myosin-binding protein [Thalictrum thalictroides]